jgi:hypothetical protein
LNDWDFDQLQVTTGGKVEPWIMGAKIMDLVEVEVGSEVNRRVVKMRHKDITYL